MWKPHDQGRPALRLPAVRQDRARAEGAGGQAHGGEAVPRAGASEEAEEGSEGGGVITYYPESDRYDFNTDVSVEDIKQSFRDHNNGPSFSMFETGLNGLRFDLIRVDPYKRYIRIFEFKSSRNDFISDKKWQKYRKYCHTLTFVCPRETIQKNDLPTDIGLIWVYKWKHKILDHWQLTQEWIKKPKSREVDKETILSLAFMLIYRVIWRKDDVF